ncbi:hypothetical protein GCM10010211_07140 [Streptomyces albospinus]|uniref:Winged helix DNA-binding domain-containing protein n=1 Tax=Streptomyces albospinus TaxID=285515 RepID=A0ABQ2UNC2_9ACTN|nr:winged helix DNA-binding domain-containing protein [Streptomyces albospinus]GGU46204.1 hypothetical protein GCM10010211_07140 [Streptomyces albospinus]
MTQRRTAPVLSARALGRATLERQLLLKRVESSALEAVERLVGLQAQAPRPPYEALAARLAGFRPEELSGLLESRRAVRIPVMRSTIHLVSARDAGVLRALTRQVHERTLRGNFAKRLAGADLARLTDAARALLEERPLTFAELGERLQEEWPEHERWPLSMAARQLLPLVQVTPRGLWGRSGPAAHTTLAAWLGERPAGEPGASAERCEPGDPRAALTGVLLRYLAAFGPASVKDMQTWSGLTRLREIVEPLVAEAGRDPRHPRLRTFRDENGVELFDLPGAPLPDPDTEAPVRFLPEFDNVLLSHADRTRLLPPAYQGRTWSRNVAYRVLLVDGSVRGLWSVETADDRARLVVEPFAPLTAAERTAVEEEAAGVLRTAAPGAAHDVRYGQVAQATG